MHVRLRDDQMAAVLNGGVAEFDGVIDYTVVKAAPNSCGVTDAECACPTAPTRSPSKHSKSSTKSKHAG